MTPTVIGYLVLSLMRLAYSAVRLGFRLSLTIVALIELGARHWPLRAEGAPLTRVVWGHGRA
ncbi:MAG TPA: hypothetical protein VLM76_02700 [Patescibacteria group bacterium]|nr:hypothetical protein [Patescibacteria group bacterium]